MYYSTIIAAFLIAASAASSFNGTYFNGTCFNGTHPYLNSTDGRPHPHHHAPNGTDHFNGTHSHPGTQPTRTPHFTFYPPSTSAPAVATTTSYPGGDFAQTATTPLPSAAATSDCPDMTTTTSSVTPSATASILRVRGRSVGEIVSIL